MGEMMGMEDEGEYAMPYAAPYVECATEEGMRCMTECSSYWNPFSFSSLHCEACLFHTKKEQDDEWLIN